MPKLWKEIMEQLPNSPKRSLLLKEWLWSVKKWELWAWIKDNDNIKNLEKSIQKTKEVLPIEVDKEGFIVDWEHRYKALLNLWVTDIPIFVWKQMWVSWRLEKPYQWVRVKVSLPPLPKKWK